MSTEIPGTMLLDPKVIDDPYPFYRRLHAEAPVWRVPGTEVCIVSTFALVVEATGRCRRLLFQHALLALPWRQRAPRPPGLR